MVAAVTLPTLMTNINERVQKEQVRSAKYKLTLATDKMKSLGLLGEQYGTMANGDATERFVAELSKHFKIAKICDNNHLRDCWPTDEINVLKSTGVFEPVQVNTLKTGTQLKALALNSANTRSVGIITADGTPMIMVYSPSCSPLESEKTYSWSTVDNKPETNATTNCISMIMDINGSKKPNRFGKDVRTLNSLFGAEQTTSYSKLDNAECARIKDKLGINQCRTDGGNDYWGGAVKYCYDRGLHLPSTQTLALMAGMKYGRTDITPKTVISTVKFAKTNWGDQGNKSCEQIWKEQGWSDSDQIICVGDETTTSVVAGQGGTTPEQSVSLSGYFWSASESSASNALTRHFGSDRSCWYSILRNSRAYALCLGD